jgi:anthranilate phosphoribosyltransferase
LLERVEAGCDLSRDEMAGCIQAVIERAWDDERVVRFLVALHGKGESVEELAGAAEAVRRGMTRIRTSRPGLLDTCGTGGDGSRTFNISTAAALVVAAAGVPVAKHGNRGITSTCGSADVLAVLGVDVDAPLSRVESCLEEVGICFCFAPLWHPSMRHVAAIRRRLDFPTVFNLVGPLCNPAGAGFQLMGVGRCQWRVPLAEVARLLGTRRAMTVWGEDGLDEVTLAAETQVSLATPAGVQELRLMPEEFGIQRQPLDTLRVSDAAQSAALIRQVLAGAPGPARDIVVLNAATSLWAVGVETDLRRCAACAAEAIDDGRAAKTLAQLALASTG